MAQEQKYVSRLEALDDYLRAQEGLPPRNRGLSSEVTGARNDGCFWALTGHGSCRKVPELVDRLRLCPEKVGPQSLSLRQRPNPKLHETLLDPPREPSIPTVLTSSSRMRDTRNPADVKVERAIFSKPLNLDDLVRMLEIESFWGVATSIDRRNLESLSPVD